MNTAHKALRARLRRMPVPAARALLDENLPKKERDAIYYRDVEQMGLLAIAELMHYEERYIKQLRSEGYEKLAALLMDMD